MLVPKAEPDNKTGCCRVDAYCTSSCVSRAPPMDGNTADSLTALCELRSTQRVSWSSPPSGKILLLCRRQKCPRAQLPFRLRKPLTASVSLFVSERQSFGTWCCSLQPRVDTSGLVAAEVEVDRYRPLFHVELAPDQGSSIQSRYLSHRAIRCLHHVCGSPGAALCSYGGRDS